MGRWAPGRARDTTTARNSALTMSGWKSAPLILKRGPQSAAQRVYVSVASPSNVSSSWPHSQCARRRGCKKLVWRQRCTVGRWLRAAADARAGEVP